jgi:hypothetical protein
MTLFRLIGREAARRSCDVMSYHAAWPSFVQDEASELNDSHGVREENGALAENPCKSLMFRKGLPDSPRRNAAFSR